MGARQASVGIQYCDCLCKQQEVISQFWALSIAQGVEDWLLNGAAVLLAIGIGLAGVVLSGRAMPSRWQVLSVIAALLLVLAPLFEIREAPR